MGADEQGEAAVAGAAGAHFAESWGDMALGLWRQGCRHRALVVRCVGAAALNLYLLSILLFVRVLSTFAGDAEAMGSFSSWLFDHWAMAAWFVFAACTGIWAWGVCAIPVVALAFGWYSNKEAAVAKK